MAVAAPVIAAALILRNAFPLGIGWAGGDASDKISDLVLAAFFFIAANQPFASAGVLGLREPGGTGKAGQNEGQDPKRLTHLTLPYPHFKPNARKNRKS